MTRDLLPFDKRRKPEYPEVEERAYLRPRQKIALVTRQKHCCAICRGKPTKFEFDHILALSEGGTNAPENWQALCPDCHATKGKGEARRRKKRNRLKGKTGQWARRQRNRPEMIVTRGGSLKVRR